MADLSQSQLRHLFTVPFLSHVFDDCAALNDDLRRIVLAREQASPGQRKTNIGGWQSSEDFHKWSGASGAELVRRIGELANHATNQLFSYYQTSDELTWNMAVWANVNRRGEYNLVHIHPGATWSGVYYVDAGDPVDTPKQNGNITFLNPILPSTYSFFTKALPNQYSIAPTAGQMVLFPSYLQHQVHPYWGERPRISIAFNIKKDPFP